MLQPYAEEPFWEVWIPALLKASTTGLISTVGVAEVNLCFYCTALTRIHTIHTVRAEGSLVRSDSGLELVQALLPAGRLQAADRRLI